MPETAVRSIDRDLYAGANWIRKDLNVTLSPLGERVADLLGWVFYGIYHLDYGALRRANWGNTHYVRLALSCRGWATYDGDQLTRLVIACHDLCIRMEINPCNFHHLELLFHPREREGRTWARHPTMEDAIARARAERREGR
jgi:hypothetical protein